MGRGSARKLLCWLVVPVVAQTACVVPIPFEERNDSTAYPPEILLDDVRPNLLTSINAYAVDCSAFDVDVRMLDRDSALVRYRWVANNALPEKATALLNDGEEVIVPNRPALLAATIVPNQDFPEEYAIANGPLHPPQTGFLTLFVTDGDWAIEDPINTGDPQDFGQPVVDDAGVSSRVVQISWAFVFEAGIGECPQ